MKNIAQTKAAKAEKAAKVANAPPGIPATDFWKLRLYVAGQTPKSLRAFANLKRLCDERLHGRYTIEITDLLEHPHLAKDDQILAIPTLVRRLPAPMRKIIGDLSNTERVLLGMELQSEPRITPDTDTTLDEGS